MNFETLNIEPLSPLASRDPDLTAKAMSDDGTAIWVQLGEAGKYYLEPYSRFKRAPLLLFNDLAATWKYDTRATSMVYEIVMHPAYQKIIGMGPKALPFIFKDLASETAHWFPALEAITQESPVPQAEFGDVEAMRTRWLEWANNHAFF
jgi:hypothetical protein